MNKFKIWLLETYVRLFLDKKFLKYGEWRSTISQEPLSLLLGKDSVVYYCDLSEHFATGDEAWVYATDPLNPNRLKWMDIDLYFINNGSLWSTNMLNFRLGSDQHINELKGLTTEDDESAFLKEGEFIKGGAVSFMRKFYWVEQPLQAYSNFKSIMLIKLLRLKADEAIKTATTNG